MTLAEKSNLNGFTCSHLWRPEVSQNKQLNLYTELCNKIGQNTNTATLSWQRV